MFEHNLYKLSMFTRMASFLFFLNFTSKTPFCVATDTHILDFWWCLVIVNYHTSLCHIVVVEGET